MADTAKSVISLRFRTISYDIWNKMLTVIAKIPKIASGYEVNYEEYYILAKEAGAFFVAMNTAIVFQGMKANYIKFESSYINQSVDVKLKVLTS